MGFWRILSMGIIEDRNYSQIAQAKGEKEQQNLRMNQGELQEKWEEHHATQAVDTQKTTVTCDCCGEIQTAWYIQTRDDGILCSACDARGTLWAARKAKEEEEAGFVATVPLVAGGER